MHGSVDDVSAEAGLAKEIVSRFKLVQELNKEDKKTVLSLLDAYIAKSRIQSILQHQYSKTPNRGFTYIL